jgi:hypothetical protein
MEGELPSGKALNAGASVLAPKVGTATKFELSQSKHHKEIAKQMKERAEYGRIFGQSWKSFFGFFAPFGTDNSFWKRLQKSRAFKHLFIFDHKAVDSLDETPLSEEADVARVTVSDVDAAVNTSALVCALLLSVPCTIMSSVSGNSDAWRAFLEGGNFPGVWEVQQCVRIPIFAWHISRILLNFCIRAT